MIEQHTHGLRSDALDARQVDGFESDEANAGPDKGKRVVNDWKVSGLPWSYALDKAKMYLPNDPQ